ncbi:DUF1292 domain-containing protein [Defluviitalea phaphyphila]|uniref:DUF1292 domain-containing protein n=1 Tax=Defluviitalea phaphyphila TaxID=1473580 RepID=UPI000731B24B|nr:DUF1292 domain-containing protein [Defluviitalea phaphyphila]
MKNNIFLIDEETEKEIEFEIIDAIEKDGEKYILVTPIEENEKEEAFILKDISENDKEAIYKLLNDENENLDKIVSYFLEGEKDYSIEF